MRLKYYLRGAGIGMLISAVLFAVFLTVLNWGPQGGSASKDKRDEGKALVGDTVTEAAAKEVERTEKEQIAGTGRDTSSDLKSGTTDDGKKIVADQRDEKSYEETDPPTCDEDDDEGLPGDGGAVDVTEEGPASGAYGDTVTFRITSGEDSYRIASHLKDAGLIDSASDFDSFLSQGGYDHVLRTGEFELYIGMSYEDIAKKLTGR